jgi:hypothetical protein
VEIFIWVVPRLREPPACVGGDVCTVYAEERLKGHLQEKRLFIWPLGSRWVSSLEIRKLLCEDAHEAFCYLDARVGIIGRRIPKRGGIEEAPKSQSLCSGSGSQHPLQFRRTRAGQADDDHRIRDDLVEDLVVLLEVVVKEKAVH